MFSLRIPGLVLGPRLTRRPDELVVSSPWLVRVLRLFAYLKIVRVDRRLQVVFFEERSFWFIRTTRAVRFGDIDHVEYAYCDVPSSWDILGRGHDAVESFSVGLFLKGSNEVVSAARFTGDGAAGDFSTWVLGDDLVDLEGTQADDSRHFVLELCEMLGVSLGPAPLPPKPDAEGNRWKCSGCGRAVPARPKCLYCGGEAGPG